MVLLLRENFDDMEKKYYRLSKENVRRVTALREEYRALGVELTRRQLSELMFRRYGVSYWTVYYGIRRDEQE